MLWLCNNLDINLSHFCRLYTIVIYELLPSTAALYGRMELILFLYIAVFNGLIRAHGFDGNLSAVCQRMPYLDKCPDGSQSQFTIRWYVKDNMCTSYSFGYCAENTNSSKDTTLRTKAACESLCVKNTTSEALPVLKTKVTLMVSSLRSADTYFFNNYSCERRPFRRTCSFGLPSKFTFRWYFDGFACLAYPFGLCKEYESSEHVKTPKTKQICELFCNNTSTVVFPTPKFYSFTNNQTWYNLTPATYANYSTSTASALQSPAITTTVVTTEAIGTSKKLPGRLPLEDDPILGVVESVNGSEKQKFASSFDFERGYVRSLTLHPKTESNSNLTWNSLGVDNKNGTLFNITNAEDIVASTSIVL